MALLPSEKRQKIQKPYLYDCECGKSYTTKGKLTQHRKLQHRDESTTEFNVGRALEEEEELFESVDFSPFNLQDNRPVNFDALSWYTSAKKSDTLYTAVKTAVKQVATRKDVTRYLQHCDVSKLADLSIREVLALYLVDVATQCQKTRSRHGAGRYKAVCALIQLYNACLCQYLISSNECATPENILIACNDFMNYIPQECVPTACQLLKHLSVWLENRNFSSITIQEIIH